MKKFFFRYPWTDQVDWMLPDNEEMMQNQFKILDEQIDTVLLAMHRFGYERRLCVQAGGAFGMYPLRLSYHFEHVWTFEPLLANLQCIHENIPIERLDNIRITPQALWHEDAWLWMKYSKPVKNSYGAHHVSFHNTAQESEKVRGVFLDRKMKTVFQHLDLLWLDIEGAESYALQGALETITTMRPVVVVEQRSLPQLPSLKVDAGSAGKWLEKQGYRFHARTHGDCIYIPSERKKA